MIEITEELTPIQKFYSGTNIFITGGTGFLGRILIDKLLRSCPDISTLYILIRNKKGKDLHARMDDLFGDIIFDRLKKECPKYRHKIVGIGGDCSVPGLGLNLQDEQLLINEVNIIFHVAATVRFDEKLKFATAINIRGPHDILELSRQMLNLKVLIHVSTAYSNAPNSLIEEKFYSTPIDGMKLMLLTENLPDNMIDKLTPTILEKWPNTYTFTKAIAEDLIRQQAKNLPIGIFRPSIVVSTYKEPIKAWINNLYGPTGVCAGAGTGVLRTLYCNPKVNANIVPVDMCVNSLIAVAWDVAENYNKNKLNDNEIPIYHYESSNDQAINWGRFMYFSETFGTKTPSVKAIWYYSLTLQKTYIGYLLSMILLHYLPALLVDTALVCVGKSPKMLKIYKKIHKFSGVISYFATRNWKFHSHRIRQVINSMSEKDKQIFFCDMKKLEWEEFFRTYLRGIRVFLIQDPMDTLDEAQVKWTRLYYLHQTVKVLVVFTSFRILWWIFSVIINNINIISYY